MSPATVVLIAFGLAMDAFAVAIGAGLTIPALTGRHVFRLSFHFGLFQFIMPIVGWLAGRTVEPFIKPYDHWVAFGLLAFVGSKMIVESRRPARLSRSDPTRGWTLVLLSVATSIDALAAGLSMAFLGLSIWWPSAVIGVVAAGMTCVGVLSGSRLGRAWGRRADVVGGVVLIGLGVRILLSHLAG